MSVDAEDVELLQHAELLEEDDSRGVEEERARRGSTKRLCKSVFLSANPLLALTCAAGLAATVLGGLVADNVVPNRIAPGLVLLVPEVRNGFSSRFLFVPMLIGSLLRRRQFCFWWLASGLQLEARWWAII